MTQAYIYHSTGKDSYSGKAYFDKDLTLELDDAVDMLHVFNDRCEEEWTKEIVVLDSKGKELDSITFDSEEEMSNFDIDKFGHNPYDVLENGGGWFEIAPKGDTILVQAIEYTEPPKCIYGGRLYNGKEAGDKAIESNGKARKSRKDSRQARRDQGPDSTA